MSTELRLLTAEAAKNRFNFVWEMECCGAWPTPLFTAAEGAQALQVALTFALEAHGKLDFGLARMEKECGCKTEGKRS